MKNLRPLLVAIICTISLSVFSQKEYKITDLVPNKKTTCWNVTKGTAAFGADICFNTNSTAKHATGGFGGIRFKKDQLTLVDLNGKSTDSQKPLVYTIKSVSSTKIVLIDDKKATIELTFKK
ncbi:MAG: hypothetical protein K0S32_1969 [Bacteroidetes bacterium]|jgi:hypothetical protein|nr:hypothetical protein [Bacteroidota bacterium]